MNTSSEIIKDQFQVVHYPDANRDRVYIFAEFEMEGEA